MKVLAVTSVVVVVVLARPAAACGVPDVGRVLADAVSALAGTHESVSVPLVLVGAGDIALGEKSLELGYGWGDRQHDGMFPGSDLTRVLAGIHTDGKDVTISATYGWFENGIGSLALDLGAEATVTGTRGFGPTARLTLGGHGIGVRFTGTALAASEPRVDGRIELVVDVMDLTGQI